MSALAGPLTEVEGLEDLGVFTSQANAMASSGLPGSQLNLTLDMSGNAFSGVWPRWLFNALHDFDLPFLLANRALRDPLMWLLSGFGIMMSLSGIVIGWRHLVQRRKRGVAARGRMASAPSSGDIPSSEGKTSSV